jgi:hypothetical protein
MAIDTGTTPPTVLDNEGFSPLLDMLNGHLWGLWCDRSLTTDTKLNRQYRSTAMMAETLGAAIPGHFCSNFAYHFKVANKWANGYSWHCFSQRIPTPPHYMGAGAST